MQIKGENGGDSKKEGGGLHAMLAAQGHSIDNLDLNTGRGGPKDMLNDTGLSSTFKSIDLPPKEYEQQLQQYEAEVRNHIKVEQ